jgi:splicing factor 3A subunit 1
VSVLFIALDSMLIILRSEAAGAMGPGIGPASVPPPMATLPPAPASLPAPPQATSSSSSGAYSAATVSSGPQPASLYSNQNPPVMLPPLHYQGLDAAQPFGYQPPPQTAISPPGMHPSRLAALAAGPGVVRSADKMEGVEEQPAKRQKVAKLPGGQCYPETDWINMHPVGCLPSSRFHPLTRFMIVE